MLTKSITYKDFNGVERTEEFFFHLTKADLVEMQLSVYGGLDAMIKRIVNTTNEPELIKMFKELILKSYGEPSADGKRFVRFAPDGHRLADDFAQTAAYSVLFMELATDAEAAAKFVNGITPEDMDLNTLPKL
jgi:hypothetical protein